jgi:hypothetical protein
LLPLCAQPVGAQSSFGSSTVATIEGTDAEALGASVFVLRYTMSQPSMALGWTVWVNLKSAPMSLVSGSVTVEVPELGHVERLNFVDVVAGSSFRLGGPPV